MAAGPLTPDDTTRQNQRDHAYGQVTGADMQGCQPGHALSQTNDAIRCGRQTLPDPTSLAPMLLMIAAGLLIIGGTLTLAGKGPAALCRRRSRSRREARRRQERLRLAGLAMIGAGIASIVFIVILLVTD